MINYKMTPGEKEIAKGLNTLLFGTSVKRPRNLFSRKEWRTMCKKERRAETLDIKLLAIKYD